MTVTYIQDLHNFDCDESVTVMFLGCGMTDVFKSSLNCAVKKVMGYVVRVLSFTIAFLFIRQ